MGVVMLILDGLVDFAQWAVKTTTKMVKTAAPYVKKGAEGLCSWIYGHISENRIELKPINISLVAPSGFGKTTLISTIIKDMELTLTRTDKNRTFELNVRPKNEDDNKRLYENNKTIVQAINTGSGRLSTIAIEGTGKISSFQYEIALSAPDNKKELIQPFCMMDIPGGWINPENRKGGDISSKWSEFEAHLHESRILWIPIDAVALMEAKTPDEEKMRSELMDIADMASLASEWAKYRTDDEESCICFVPVKCETYKLFENENSALDFRKKFDAMCKQIVEDVSLAKGNANIKMYYIPVETIGCIKKNNTSWEKQKEKTVFKAEYQITGSHRAIKGANLLINKVYEYAYNQIDNMEKYDENLLKNVNIIEKKKAEMDLGLVKKAIKPIKDELEKYTATAEKLEEAYM